MRVLLVALSLASLAQAATKVAVVEVGVGGAVRRTQSRTWTTSVEGVASFWQAMHPAATGRPGGRKLQHAGMTVVPDLFTRADAGVVIGLSGTGVDLEEMPVAAGLVQDEGQDASGVVGHLQVPGSHCDSLMKKSGVVKDVEAVDSSLSERVSKKAQEYAGLSGLTMEVDASNAPTIDAQLQDMIAMIDRQAKLDQKTVVIYLVVEEDAAAARRREITNPTSAHRRLDEEEEGEQNEGGDAEDDAANQNGNNNGQYAGYYGYGYYNAYGEWVTPYKTMFQIQYFNVVLWTAVGLTATLFFTVYLMVNMPLMADTLLFGESAKMVGDD